MTRAFAACFRFAGEIGAGRDAATRRIDTGVSPAERERAKIPILVAPATRACLGSAIAVLLIASSHYPARSANFREKDQRDGAGGLELPGKRNTRASVPQ